MGPYYYVGTDYLNVFDIETCENCERTVRAANMVNVVKDDERKLRALGSRKVFRVPPEQYWDEAKGHCVCEMCDGDEALVEAAEAAGGEA